MVQYMAMKKMSELRLLLICEVYEKNKLNSSVKQIQKVDPIEKLNFSVEKLLDGLKYLFVDNPDPMKNLKLFFEEFYVGYKGKKIFRFFVYIAR